jgi:hypothetical protein
MCSASQGLFFEHNPRASGEVFPQGEHCGIGRNHPAISFPKAKIDRQTAIRIADGHEGQEWAQS